MAKIDGIIGPEDYQEPQCVLCGKTGEREVLKPIPQQRVIEKLDEYIGKHDYEGAEKHLQYWKDEAIYGRDQRGELLCSNEMMGIYRKTGDKEKAIENAVNAVHLISILELENSITAGTTYVNAATVYDAFGKLELSVSLFEKAQKIYEENLSETDSRLGGLYNNMGLAKEGLGRYGEAFEYYNKALEVMKENNNGKLEMAITYLNMANAVEDEHGLEKGEQKINQYLDLAEDLLFSGEIKNDSYKAFVYEKCAPTFAYYGYFLTAQKLEKKSNELYNRA